MPELPTTCNNTAYLLLIPYSTMNDLHIIFGPQIGYTKQSTKLRKEAFIFLLYLSLHTCTRLLLPLGMRRNVMLFKSSTSNARSIAAPNTECRARRLSSLTGNKSTEGLVTIVKKTNTHTANNVKT